MHCVFAWRINLCMHCRWVFRIGMPETVRIELINKMADVEYRLAFGTSEKLQLGALVGAFAEAKEGIIQSAV